MTVEECLKYKEENKFFGGSIIKRIEVAIVLNELPKMITGFGEYEWSRYELKYIPVKVRVDHDLMLRNGFHVLYKNGNKDIPRMLLDALYKLFDGNLVEVSAAFAFIWSQYGMEIKEKSPFKIITKELLNDLEKAVKGKKEKLIAYKDYEAYGEKNGMWGDMIRRAQIFKMSYGVDFITLD